MVWSWLRSWWRGAPARAVRVVMYTRRGCPLCDEAWRQLQEARRRFDFVLEAVDVDDDAGLTAQYGSEVPVVTVDGRVRFRGCVNAVLLTRLLRAETT